MPRMEGNDLREYLIKLRAFYKREQEVANADGNFGLYTRMEGRIEALDIVLDLLKEDAE